MIDDCSFCRRRGHCCVQDSVRMIDDCLFFVDVAVFLVFRELG